MTYLLYFSYSSVNLGLFHVSHTTTTANMPRDCNVLSDRNHSLQIHRHLLVQSSWLQLQTYSTLLRYYLTVLSK